MAIQFATLVQRTYTAPSGDFHLYRIRCSGGHWTTGIYLGIDPPKPLKTVEYQLTGEWSTHPKFGERFIFQTYQRSAIPDNQTELAIVREARKHIGPLR